ncbi:MAG: hypothetical protein IT381_31125 [Deltaproteobacteria bacterium]|nr:hypothetical protein [Deltaproteobacteria bacterium]
MIVLPGVLAAALAFVFWPHGPPRLSRVDRLIAADMDKLQACYSDVSHLDPLFAEARSHIRMWLSVSPTGEVIDAELNRVTMVRDLSVLPCMEQVVRRWRFLPEPGGGRVVFAVFQHREQVAATVFEAGISDLRP